MRSREHGRWIALVLGALVLCGCADGNESIAAAVDAGADGRGASAGASTFDGNPGGSGGTLAGDAGVDHDAAGASGAGGASDVWTAVGTTGAPPSRRGHVAVWAETVGQMLIWGNGELGPDLPGGRYDPVSKKWSPISTNDSPEAHGATAVWTGSELIVWGGKNANDPDVDAGGRYDPQTDTWASLSLENAPSTRRGHSMVWTGASVIVWGGAAPSFGSAPVDASELYEYDPATDAWSVLQAANPPAGRADHSAVWTGDELIIWGGVANSSRLASGARWNPSTNAWVAIPEPSDDPDAPSARSGSAAVWTGSELIVWGGHDDTGYLASGSRFDPVTNEWHALSTAGAPSARAEHTAVWTGDTAIIWGGASASTSSPSAFVHDGARYDPAADAWSPLSTSGYQPAPRRDHSAVWGGTPTRMWIWGGVGLYGEKLNDGAGYLP